MKKECENCDFAKKAGEKKYMKEEKDIPDLKYCSFWHDFYYDWNTCEHFQPKVEREKLKNDL